MSLHLRRDPGPCPVDQAPHTSCTAPDAGTIMIPQLPARDGLETPPLVGGSLLPPLVGQLPTSTPTDEGDGETFSTGTYRGKGRAGRAR